MKVRVDRSAVTFMPMCACGWRGLPQDDHSAALRQARHHEMRAHPGDQHARRAIAEWDRRHAAF